MDISTHSLTRRLTQLSVILLAARYFNSQPHEEADYGGHEDWYDGNISTHSLTRRLTKRKNSMYVPEGISTHSLTRRLTDSGKIRKDGEYPKVCVNLQTDVR